VTNAIRTDAFLPHPPEKVWRALTDPGLLASWLMPNDFQARAGHRFTFCTDPVPAQGFDGIVHCEVLDLVAPELLRISWIAGGLDTTVTWRLIPEGNGTRLLLSHEGFDENDPRQQVTMRLLGGGWSGHLTRRLEQTLAALV
jgi:uncharacterized protein YndB with AHSA1/START domain